MDNRILAKYIFNEATAKEKTSVEQWLAEDIRHRQELERLCEQLETASRRYREGAFDSRKALKQIISRPVILRTLYLRYAGVAAILLLGIVLWRTNPFSPQTVTLSCASGETAVYLLPDSSRVTLSGPATLNYSHSFNRQKREVISNGMSYFEVKKDSKKPFIVSTPLLNIEVLGTTFQVESSEKSTEVLVREGRVRVSTANNSGEEVLTAGMSAGYSSGDNTISVSGFDDNRLSWKTGIFRFENSPLDEVISLLNRHYQANILLPEEHAGLHITVSFHHMELEDALMIINETLNIHLENTIPNHN